MSMECPICETELSEKPVYAGVGDKTRYSCKRCGSFVLTGTLVQTLPHTLISVPNASAKLSHALRRAQEVNTEVEFSTSTIDAVLKRPLPNPKEQADLLIRWIAQNIGGPGEKIHLHFSTHAGIVGAISVDGFALILRHLFDADLLTGPTGQEAMIFRGEAKATLSFDGWLYYETLEKGGMSYSKAFMAMEFGKEDLIRMLEDVFKPAVLQAGFELYKLDDQPKAGLIDDRLRVEIQGSDFLIADLTHRNPGAYWEAGYAEGLGKPVIYTCEKSCFENESTKPHFDTNHHLTIIWEEANSDVAASNLKATIRATLPHLAKQID